MDKSKIVDTLHEVLDDTADLDVGSREYLTDVACAEKLNRMLTERDNYELAKDRNDFDKKMRKKTLNLEKRKLENEKTQRTKDRNFDAAKAKWMHEEKMKELEIAEKKAENDNLILKQNQIKMENESKANRRKDLAIFGVKVFGILMITVINVCMHKDELRFEREEYGLVPARCKVYDATVNKASEIIMK